MTDDEFIQQFTLINAEIILRAEVKQQEVLREIARDIQNLKFNDKGESKC